MKTQIFATYCFILLSMLVIINLMSCQKEVNDNEVNFELINEILELEDNVIGTMAFSLLNPNEKSFLFRKKIQDFIINNDLNKEQISLLNELYNFVEPRLYIPEFIDMVVPEFENFEKQWTLKALILFEKEELYRLAFQVVEFDSSLKLQLKQHLPNCKCSTNSSAACLFGHWGECNKGNCNETDRGCGLVGFAECDGLCGSADDEDAPE